MKIPISGPLLRRAVVPAVALTLMIALFIPARAALLPTAEEPGGPIASRFDFTEMPIALPPGLDTQRQIRDNVNPQFAHLSAWISSVGSSIAMNDMDGNRRADDLCVVDVRSDSTFISPTPDSNTGRYQPFVLDPGPLPTDDSTVPSGCVPGDFNADGRTDLLVNYLGRTPIVYLQRGDADRLDAKAFRPVELVPSAKTEDGRYHGDRWVSTNVSVSDFDGDGSADIYIGNYFRDTDVLSPETHRPVEMSDSFSNATNGGEDRIFTVDSASAGPEPDAKFGEVTDAFPPGTTTGWSLASAAADLNGDLLPEMYVGNDFGPDHLFVNKSEPGRIKFETAEGQRGWTDPKSHVMGHDSFKGMAADFADLNGDAMPDLFVSNISARLGLVEGHLAFYNTARDTAEAAEKLGRGVAPFENRATDVGLAWNTWGWDAKINDFDNDGRNELVQATGMIKGDTNRWPQLQEIGTMNDGLVRFPWAWSVLDEDADLSGSDPLGFFAQGEDGKFSNLSTALGMDHPVPTRGIAVGDTDGNGTLAFAVSRQWEDPVFYRNNLDTGRSGQSLGLQLVEPVADGSPVTTTSTGKPVLGVPAIDTQVEVRTPDGRMHTGHLDGGSGHSGKRATEVHIGLGDVDPAAELDVRLRWRDRTGAPQEQTVRLTPGRHILTLASTAQEVK